MISHESEGISTKLVPLESPYSGLSNKLLLRAVHSNGKKLSPETAGPPKTGRPRAAVYAETIGSLISHRQGWEGPKEKCHPS